MSQDDPGPHVLIHYHTSKEMYPNIKFKPNQRQGATWDFVEKHTIGVL